MEFLLFEVTKRQNGKECRKWYYEHTDSLTGTKKTRVCRKCTSRIEAEKFVRNLEFASAEQYLVKNIARDMFIPGSKHLERLSAFGKNLCEQTVKQKRQFVLQIIQTWGNCYINKIRIMDIENFLIKDKSHSGSWKNYYLETLGNIYDETVWKCQEPVAKPKFQKFVRNTRKADIFSTEELEKLFTIENWNSYWNSYKTFLLFLCIASCGLRIGEARALRPKQFLFDKQMLVIDGFCKRNGFRTCYNKTGSAEDTKLRIVPVPEKTLKLIKKYISGKNTDPDNFIFTADLDEEKPICQEYLDIHFKKALKKAGISVSGRKLVPHSLRFTYVTRMRRTLTVEQVQKIAGHTSAEMTEYYTRVAIPEMVNSLQSALPAANRLFS